MIDLSKLPKKLSRARRLLSVTQQQAAEGSRVHQPHISDMEAREKSLLPARYLAFLHNRGVDLNTLFHEGPVRFRDADQLTSRNQALEENAKHQEAELEQRREELVALGSKLDSATIDRDIARNQRDALRVEKAKLLKRLEEAKSGIGTVADRVADKLGDQVDSLQSDVARLRQDVQGREQRIAELEKEVRTITGESCRKSLILDLIHRASLLH